MLSVTATDGWRSAHAGATIGLLQLSGVDNTLPAPQLEAKKRQLEQRIRQDYGDRDRRDLLTDPVLSAYKEYYRRFKKTYHIQLQLESIASKGKGLPTVSPLVDSNFMAEMETLILTAVHDVDMLQPPVTIDVSHEGEILKAMGGATKAIYAGDMVMRDGEGICCSILYGQDDRSPISRATNRALYVSYAPPGVLPARVSAHHEAVEGNVRAFCPSAVVEEKRLITAG